MFQFSSDLQQNELIITFKKKFESKLRSQKQLEGRGWGGKGGRAQYMKQAF